MDFIKGQAVEGFPFIMINKSSGDFITTGTVNGYVTQDGGTQVALTGTAVHEGNGEWSINLSAGEMNADIIGLTFTHVDAVPRHFTIKTIVEALVQTAVPATTESIVTEDDLTWVFYGTTTRADVYFSKRLNSDAWDNATNNNRESALIMATRAIDKLNFAGDKHESTQDLQFPRGDDTDVPIEIEYANYEIALALLDGYDYDAEAETLGVLSETYSGVRTTYDGIHVNEHKRAGIPCIEAWELLKPFLRDPTQVRLSRVT